MLKKIWLGLDVLALLALTALFFGGLYVFVEFPAKSWVDFVFDDGYYYLGLARSLAEGHGSQFLAPAATNGYQPLWLILLTISASIFGTTDKSMVIQAYCLTYACIVAFALLSKKYYGVFFPAIAVSFCYATIMFIGMESSLMPLLVICFFAANNWISKGVFGSALFLARIDAIALVLSTDLVSFFKGKRSTRSLRDYQHYLIIAVVVVAYLIFNQINYGVPVPISGLSKSIGNIKGENYLNALGFIKHLKVTVLFFVILLVLQLGFKLKAMRYKREILAMCSTTLIYAAYYSLNSGWPVWGWYYWPIMMLTFYLILEIIHQTNQVASRQDWNWKKTAATLLVLLVTAKAAQLTVGNYLGYEQSRNLFNTVANRELVTTFATKNIELVENINESKIPEGTMFAMGDRAGSFGFFLGNKYQFFHTEGLVNSLDYYHAMATDHGLEYMETQPVKFFIADSGHFFEQDDILGIIEPVQGVSSHVGPWLICFNKAGIVLDQSYAKQKRYMFSYTSKVACPATMQEEFLVLRKSYGALRRFSHPLEYAGEGKTSHIVPEWLAFPPW